MQGVKAIAEVAARDSSARTLVESALESVAGKLGPGTEPLTEALVEGTRTRSPVLRAWYTHLIGKLGKAGLRSSILIPALVATAVDEEEEVRCAVAYALGRVEPYTTSTVHELANLLSDPAERVQIEAVFALRRMRRASAAALPALIRLRDSASGHVRRNVSSEIHALIDLCQSPTDGDRLDEPALPGKAEHAMRVMLESDPDALKLLRTYHALGLTRINGTCSFRRTAEFYLGSNQSVAKRNVGDLADNLGGTPLVSASSQGVVMTALGLAVWAYARRITPIPKRIKT
jgi:HEAT repeat protein